MRKQFLLLNLLISSFLSHAQISPEVGNPPFQVGEELRYKIRYGLLNCAEGIMRVEESPKEFNNSKAFRLIASGQTSSAVSWIVNVQNRWDSYVNANTLLPYMFTETVREDNYRREGYISFDRKNKKANTNKGVFNINEDTFDIISMFYYARALELSGVRPGDVLTFSYFLDDTLYPMNIRYLGKEKVKTPNGKVECLKFTPSLVKGRIFKKNGKMYLWVTNDANRIPVRADVEILVGAIHLDLISYKNLKHPFGQLAMSDK
ncbi:DUF3108 domain-containing protein [Solitalea koreensis]|uniref:DUF3108 domain-containing protein n=1 Tax=Solitalea koreensis TaxID=543615 RepID=A0A521CN50_9SPHI|nr:DUF3108 domain-containing protein [Solitalea koreensis]SMO60863.1 Protein of unknown function [Solitalea koreensis]